MNPYDDTYCVFLLSHYLIEKYFAVHQYLLKYSKSSKQSVNFLKRPFFVFKRSGFRAKTHSMSGYKYSDYRQYTVRDGITETNGLSE